MGVKSASLTVSAAAVLGGSARLILYPQFVLGAALLLTSVLLKLSKNIVGIIILVAVVLISSLIVFLFNKQIIRAAKQSAPVLGKQLKKVSRRLQNDLTSLLQATPPYAITLAAFAIPAIAQFAGSLASVKMLSKIDLSPTALPGAGYVATSSILYLLSITFGISDEWLKPSKVSFLLQSFWVLMALGNASARQDMEFRQYLPSVLAGWGSFLLGLTPATAMLSAAKAAAASAAVAGAGVATFEGVRAFKSKESSDKTENTADRDTMEDELADEGEQQSEQDDDSEEEKENDVSRTSKTHSKRVSATQAVALAGVPTMQQSLESLRDWFDEADPLTWIKSARDAVFAWFKRGSAKLEQSKNTDGGNDTTENSEGEMQERIMEDVEAANFDVNTLSPPVQLVVPVILLKALPSCFTLVFSLVSSVIFALRGEFKIGMAAVPLVLTPFALGEIVSLLRHFGFRNIITGKIFQAEFKEKYSDGMSLLLWQSPQMLRAWKAMARAQNENIMENLRTAPRQFFHPDEETIRATPEFTSWVLVLLLLSVVIDVIGSSSFAVPGLGELTDVVWAPMQGFLVQRMYASPILSWVGVLEELLPFTDFIPTAVIGWCYTYGPYIPAWIARASQTRRRSSLRQKEE